MNSVDFISIFFIAIGLAADCFAVALSVSNQIKKQLLLQILRISFFFGLFQGIMPVIGWFAGINVVELIQSFDHWIAFGLLSIIGIRMIRESFQHDDENSKKTDITNWLTLLILSLATSIDALATGLSFAIIDVNITMASITIGLVSFFTTIIGLLLGRKAGNLLGKRAELIGGIILIIIATKILISHII